jgi:hypothetical protein
MPNSIEIHSGARDGPSAWGWMRSPATLPDQAFSFQDPGRRQLGYPAAKLKTRISHGERLGTVRHPIPGQNLDSLCCLQSLGAEPELEGQALVQLDQTRLSNRGRR